MTTPSSTQQEVTQLLGEWSGGDEGVLGKLFPLVHPELHRLAHHYMSRERAGADCVRLVNLDYFAAIPCAPSGSPPSVLTKVKLPSCSTRKEATDCEPPTSTYRN